MEESISQKTNYDIQNFMEKKIEDFYSKYFTNVRSYILNNSGDLDDAKDVFQELALIYFKLIGKPEFEAIENEKNYVMGITRNIWLKKIKESNKMSYGQENFDNLQVSQSNLTELLSHNELIDVILQKLDEISEECRKIIHAAFYLKLSAIEISAFTGYSDKFIKVKKYRCLQGLKKIVSMSPEYKNIQF